MAVTIADLKVDTGEVYDNLNNGTTAAAGLLSKAQQVITKITGTATGYDLAVRNLADSFICNHALGLTSSTNQSVSVISVGRKEIIAMRDNFIKECDMILGMDGYNLKQGFIGFEVVNQ